VNELDNYRDEATLKSTYKQEEGHLTMGYFDNIDNNTRNKFKKKLKIKKYLWIYSSIYISIDLHMSLNLVIV
jgi:hypothetical protein